MGKVSIIITFQFRHLEGRLNEPESFQETPDAECFEYESVLKIKMDNSGEGKDL